jgi:4-amino-4-deoxy-L-arabinose transferase-like glycosyltransferase
MAVLAAVFAFRLLTLGAYPLTDNTEARYAEIARKMVETGQWLVPQLDYGVPFWAKPPLSMWLTAGSFEVFGTNAFAARLPSLLLGIGVAWLAFCLGRWRGGVSQGLCASAIVATSLLMFVSMGGVMTDPAMVFGTTLSMAGFWRAMTTGSRVWAYAFFIGVAIGLLAKGPVATVLTVLPIAAWSIVAGKATAARRGLPWLSGTLLVVVLVLPWYWAAEIHSPGFLRYFIVGEHLERFLTPGWKGDLYGMGHASPRGMIWLYLVLGTLPWSPWLLWRMLRHRDSPGGGTMQPSDRLWRAYLMCWLLAPAVFFTLSRNILATYALPGVVGFGLLVADQWYNDPHRMLTARFAHAALATPVVALVVLLVCARIGFPSQHELVAIVQQSRAENPTLVYFRQRPRSAEFYSRGTAIRAPDADALMAQLKQTPDAFVATEETAMSLLPEPLRSTLHVIATTADRKYVLLHHADDRAVVSTALDTARGAGEEPVSERADGLTLLRSNRK